MRGMPIGILQHGNMRLTVVDEIYLVVDNNVADAVVLDPDPLLSPKRITLAMKLVVKRVTLYAR